MIVFIDSGVLGQICNPDISDETTAVKEWLFKQLARGVRVLVLTFVIMKCGEV
jgi:hypothetical protein